MTWTRPRCATCGAFHRPDVDCTPVPRKYTHETATVIAAEVRWKPLEQYPGTVQKQWRCVCMDCGQDGKPQLANMLLKRGCRPCGLARSGREHAERGRDRAVAALLAWDVVIIEYFGLKKPCKAQCLRCGNTVTPRPDNVINRDQGPCKTCGHKRGGEANRLTQEQATAVAMALDMKPLEPYVDSSLPWLCECLRCGKPSTPRYSNLISGRRCQHCAQRSYFAGESATLYLLTSPELGALKIGVASATVPDGRRVRLRDHAGLGWLVMTTWESPDPAFMHNIEQRVKRYWRHDLNLPYGATREQMPKGGFTETVPLSMMSVSDAIATVEELLSTVAV